MNFLDRFLSSPQILDFMKIHLVGADLSHVNGCTDGQTDMMKLISHFSQFCKYA